MLIIEALKSYLRSVCTVKELFKTFTSKKRLNSCLVIQEALALLEKAGVEEKRLVSAATSPDTGSGVEEGCRPPPPPVLLSRSNRSLTFTPAPYVLEEQVISPHHCEVFPFVSFVVCFYLSTLSRIRIHSLELHHIL